MVLLQVSKWLQQEVQKEWIQLYFSNKSCKFFFICILLQMSQVASLSYPELSAWLLVCSYRFWLFCYVIFQVPTFLLLKYSASSFPLFPII